MRKLTDHRAPGMPEELYIHVMDEPGAGGAHHVYTIEMAARDEDQVEPICIKFQCGPVLEAGVNGITHEALLAVLIDRLRSFQAGAFSCRENALALTKLEEALFWLHNRTRNRLERGVEGRSAK